jgi:hypothetical protein
VAASGRTDRSGRLLENRSGASGSSSADFMHLVRLQFAHSAEYAARIDGNCSPYALSAIPMLLSSLRCLVVEYASYPPRDSSMLDALTQPNDFAKMLERYRIDDPLRSESLLLQELRNEIIHPARRPSGTPDNWPEYLRVLKDKGVLQSTGRRDSDYIFFSQLQSHRLFAWSWRVTRDIVERILQSDPRKSPVLGDFLYNYRMPQVTSSEERDC